MNTSNSQVRDKPQAEAIHHNYVDQPRPLFDKIVLLYIP